MDADGNINFTMDSISKRYGLVNINPKTRVDLMGFAGTNSKANYRISEAASVGPGFICRFPQFEEYMNLEQRVFVSGILLGGSGYL